MINNINDQESVIDNIENSLFLDKEKIQKLGNNIIKNFDKLENNSMTVGIIGEWGSGKSSFLNILLGNITDSNNKYSYGGDVSENFGLREWLHIENEVKEIELIGNNENTKYLKVLSLNSWLINNIVSDPLFNLISVLSDKLELNLENNITSIQKASKYLKGTTNILTGILKDKSEGLIDIPKFNNSFNDILTLKENFKNGLEKKLRDGGKLILVIDDLDRIPPEEAVIMLDSIKLFLDNPKILIFLLNDKNIVKRGLKKKLGLDEEEEAEEIAESYLDKLINVEIDIEEYYNENRFKDDIKGFIEKNAFIMAIEGLSDKIKNDNDIIKKIHQIKNMRRVKKLFKNFEIQAPSIVDYTDDSNDKLDKYFEYFNKILKKYDSDSK